MVEQTTIEIENIEITDGKKKDGSKWVKHDILGTDKKHYTSFDEGEQIKSLRKHMSVTLQFEPTKYKTYRNLTKIISVGLAPASSFVTPEAGPTAPPNSGNATSPVEVGLPAPLSLNQINEIYKLATNRARIENDEPSKGYWLNAYMERQRQQFELDLAKWVQRQKQANMSKFR